MKRAALRSLLLLLPALLPAAATAADTVVYATGKDGHGRATVVGTIVDATGVQLVLRTEADREQIIPAARVVEIKTPEPAEQREGDRLAQAGRFAEATEKYLQALRQESRVWAQRRLLGKLIPCLGGQGQHAQAGEAFLRLVRSDPQTSAFPLIPLAWVPAEPAPALEQQCRAWLANEREPAAQLLGASWLLPTAQRAAAIAVLRRLATERDTRVAFLAEAQLWRTEIATASAAETARWQSRVLQMPAELRGGPYFVVGTAWAARDQHAAAALALLRVPICYPEDRRLAAVALLSAGRELEKIGHVAEAVGLYRELVREYADAPETAAAAARLEQLGPEESPGPMP